MNKKFNRIAIIGARETPATAFKDFVKAIGNDDVIVTSGNAYGADQFSKYWKKNIQYLPWDGYNKELGYGLKHIVAGDVTRYDSVIFKLFPWIKGKSQGVLRLVRRNMCMIAGIDGKHRVDAVFYWAEETNGVVKGGTRYAVDFARSLGIPTFNLKNNMTNESKDLRKEVTILKKTNVVTFLAYAENKEELAGEIYSFKAEYYNTFNTNLRLDRSEYLGGNQYKVYLVEVE